MSILRLPVFGHSPANPRPVLRRRHAASKPIRENAIKPERVLHRLSGKKFLLCLHGFLFKYGLSFRRNVQS